MHAIRSRQIRSVGPSEKLTRPGSAMAVAETYPTVKTLPKFALAALTAYSHPYAFAAIELQSMMLLSSESF